ncbi:MAG: hypothetical protein M1504_03580 [Candidatus Marsarchaeota archaeon]|nr:hypothetical protein [Candidatus Marsarchaeota archaeon]
MPYVIIDTSSILFGFKYRKDVFDIARYKLTGSKLMISRGVLRELNRLSQNKGKKGATARAALLTIKYKKIEIDNNNAVVDKWILSVARKLAGPVVITNDTELSMRLKALDVKCLKLTRDGLLK